MTILKAPTVHRQITLSVTAVELHFRTMTEIAFKRYRIMRLNIAMLCIYDLNFRKYT